MDEQQAKHILKNTGYIGNEVGVAFEVAIKSIDKLERIKQIVNAPIMNNQADYLRVESIRKVLEQE